MTTTQLVVTLAGGAAAGAVLTGLVTLITSALTRRHEQRRWLLDKRYEVYFTFNEAVSRWEEETVFGPNPMAGTLDAEGIRRIQTAINQHLDRMALVAPPATFLAASRVWDLTIEVLTLLPRQGKSTWRDSTSARNTLVKTADALNDLRKLQRKDLQGRRAHWPSQRPTELPTAASEGSGNHRNS